ncbi:hypothetical protein TNCV_3635601 [Trichonephila clavipes]|nr:hypothetical protein TNCV_3635601 [Trichonephila clavipes]
MVKGDDRAGTLYTTPTGGRFSLDRFNIAALHGGSLVEDVSVPMATAATLSRENRTYTRRTLVTLLMSIARYVAYFVISI